MSDSESASASESGGARDETEERWFGRSIRVYRYPLSMRFRWRGSVMIDTGNTVTVHYLSKTRAKQLKRACEWILEEA